MKIATAGSRLSRKWKTQETSWEQLVDRLRYPVRTGETVAEYVRMSKDERTAKKDVGGFVGGALTGGRRVAGAVTERWLVTLDADYAEPGDWDSFSCLHDLRCCVYSTHSHTPERPKLRWILPLSRAVTAEEYVAIARKVAEWIGIERMDPLTYQPERLMFWPSCCQDGAYEFHEQTGDTLDADAVLREYGSDGAWRDVWRWPTSSREGAIVRREERQQADPLSKPGIVGAFCRTYSVEDAIDAFDLPYERVEGAGERYTYTGGSTSGGAVVYGDGRWLYSNHATDPAGGQLCNAFDLVRVHKFGELDDGSNATDSTRLPSFQRMAELASGDRLVRDSIIDSQFGDMGAVREGKSAPVNTVSPAENDGVDALDDGDDGDDGDDWKAGLTFDRKTGQPEPTLNNACHILTHSPAFKGRLSWCAMGDQIYVTAPMPWKKRDTGRGDPDRARRIMGDGWETGAGTRRKDHGPPRMKGRVWDKQDSIELYKIFERLGYSAAQKSNGMIDNALVSAAQENFVDPICDYLRGLEWDGIERLDTLFIHWLGAEDCPLNREITRLWMLGAVDRAFRPGHQFESVLVFCGEQGIGKSRLLRMLAGDYYTNSINATSSEKANTELLQGKWIVELDEMDSVRKSSVGAFKSFISSPYDHYRKPYATDATTHLRQCVFAGTTNESSFLRDDTGERRYWILPCAGQEGMAEVGKKGTLPGFADEVDQIWAEAVWAWRERVAKMRRDGDELEDVELYLYITDPELDAEMEARRQGFKLADTVREDLEDYLETRLPDNWDEMSADSRADFFAGAWIGDTSRCNKVREVVTLKEIRTELYRERPEDAARSGRSQLVYRISSVMDSMPGWERGGRAGKGETRSVRWKRKPQ